MVRGAMDMLTSSDLGSAAVVAVQHETLKPGSVLLELIYVTECPAPPALAIERYLPASTLRLLVDPQGRERSSDFAYDDLRGTCLTRNRKLARAVVKSQAERLPGMLARAEQVAAAAAERLAESARQQAADMLGRERDRLAELQRRNAGVRDDELVALETRMAMTLRALSKLHMRLDATRVLVAH